jgi:hypothetical protein
MNITRRSWIGGGAALLLGGCASASTTPASPTPTTSSDDGIDIARLMRLANELRTGKSLDGTAAHERRPDSRLVERGCDYSTRAN